MEKRILNVGCGDDTYGTDFVDLYPSRKEVLKCDLGKDKLPFGNDTFDEVYAAFVLEHLKNPNMVIKEMVRVLKKGGQLVIKTDNAAYWLFHNEKSKKKLHYGGYEVKGAHGKSDVHFSIFTPSHVRNHLEAVNLKVKKIEYFTEYKGMSPLIYFASWMFSKTRFKPMAYGNILAVAEKT